MENTDFIEAYDNVLTPDFRKALISKFEESNRKVQGETGFGVNKRAKDSLDITLNLYPEWKKELDEIEAITRKNLVTYMRKYYHLMTGAVSLFIPNPAGGMMQITPEVLNIINDDLFEGLMNKIYKFGTLNLQKYSKGQGAYHHWHSETYPKQNEKA